MNGLIYAAVDVGGSFKIGFTRGHPDVRVRAINGNLHWVAQRRSLTLLGSTPGSIQLELYIHTSLQRFRDKSFRGREVYLPTKDVRATVEGIVAGKLPSAPVGTAHQKLVEWRLRFGVSQLNLAEASQIRQGALSLLERGKQQPSLDQAFAISIATDGGVAVSDWIAPDALTWVYPARRLRVAS